MEWEVLGGKKKAPRKKPVPPPESRTDEKKAVKKPRLKRTHDSSDDEPIVEPRKKELKAPVRKVATATDQQSARNYQPRGNFRLDAASPRCWRCGHVVSECTNEQVCYACKKTEHAAKEYPDGSQSEE